MIEPIYEEIPVTKTRRMTEHEKWLRDQIKRIDPHEGEQGNDAGYTRALEKLVLELRTENMILKGINTTNDRR